IITVEVDPMSGELAAPGCPNTRGEVFITGSQPQQMCHLHSGGVPVTQVTGWDTPDQPAETARPSPRSSRIAQSTPPGTAAEPPPPQQPEPQRRGLFDRIRGMLKRR